MFQFLFRFRVKGSGPKKRFPGLRRAICVDNNDPEQLGRIKVSCPDIYGFGPYNRSPWAWPRFASGAGGSLRVLPDGSIDVTGDRGTFVIPDEGSTVWVEFEEDGNPMFPVYSSGAWGGSAQGDPNAGIPPSQVPEEGKVLCPAGWDVLQDPRMCIDCEDLLEHGIPECFDDIEHAPFHRHNGADPKFYCPRHRVWNKSERGHTLLAIDKDGREFLGMIDNLGQCLKFYSAMRPELQVMEMPDGSLKGNLNPRGKKIMDRRTEPVPNPATAEPAAPPAAATQDVLDGLGMSQASIASALDGLLTPSVRAALAGTPLGNILDKLDNASLGGLPVTPSAIFTAFTGGATAAVRVAVTSAMEVVGTSPRALLSALTNAVDLPAKLAGALQNITTTLLGAGLTFTGIFPTMLLDAVLANPNDGYDPRTFCEQQWSAWELRDTERGWVRSETAAVIDDVSDVGPSLVPPAPVEGSLGEMGLTQAGVADLFTLLDAPEVLAALQGTPLGDLLNQLGGLSIGGIPLGIGGLVRAFVGGVDAAVRNAVTGALTSIGLTPMKALSTIINTAGLSGILSGTLAAPFTAMLSMISAIPLSLLAIFPSMFGVVGQKLMLFRSDRDMLRHQSIIIDHMPLEEKMIFSGLNLEGVQVGPQLVLDSLALGRFTIIDPTTGSFENFECSTGGSKEALYMNGRNVGMLCDDVLTIGGDWLVLAGFPPALIPRAPIDVLPVLEMRAGLAPQVIGGGVPCGGGNILNGAILNWTRWAGLSIADYATLNYDRTVGGEESIDIGGSQTLTIGEDQSVAISGGRTTAILVDDILGVLGFRSVNVGLSLTHNVGISMSSMVGLLHNIFAGLYCTSHAGVENRIKAGGLVKLMGGVPLLPGWKAGPSRVVKTKEAPVEPATFPVLIMIDGVPTESKTVVATA